MADVGSVDLGRQRHPNWHTGPNMMPYLRVANVFEDRIDTTDLKQMDFTGVYERFKLAPGDVLLNEGQTPELLGRPAIYRGVPSDVAFTNSLIRFRAGPDVLPEWALVVFRHYMHSGRFTRESRITTNIAHLSATRFKSIEFPIPPIAMQRRIVDLLDDQLSRLDAAEKLLDTSLKRLAALRRSTLAEVHAGGRISLGDLAVDAGYGTSAKCAVDGPGPPVVRIPNLVDGAINLDDEKRVADPDTDVSRYALSAGDLLIVRTNGSVDLIGRSAVVQPGVDAAYASYLIRYRVDESRVRPEWVQAMLNAPQVRARIENLAASSAGQHNLSLGKLDSLALPVPSLHEQDLGLRRVRALDVEASRLRGALVVGRHHAGQLRSALLATAFSGGLTEAAFSMSEADAMTSDPKQHPQANDRIETPCYTT